jgi:hypothetical protein
VVPYAMPSAPSMSCATKPTTASTISVGNDPARESRYCLLTL